MTAQHPFAATMEQMRKPIEDGGGFARLSDQQKWEWHSDVYAFNRMMLKRNDSPVDPKSEWHNEGMIAMACRYYQVKYIDRVERQKTASEEDRRLGSDILRRWSVANGYRDWDAAYAAGHTFSEVINWRPAAKPSKMPRDRWTANQYGVTATEWKPSEEQLKAGLADLQSRGEPVEPQ